MENATKALIIAAAILIAIVLISLGVFVLGNGTQMVKDNSDMTGTEVSAFNSKWEAYFGNNVSGTKVKQLINAVNQNNKQASDASETISLRLFYKNETAYTITGSNTTGDYGAPSEFLKTGETYKVGIDTKKPGTKGLTSSGRIEGIVITANFVN